MKKTLYFLVAVICFFYAANIVNAKEYNDSQVKSYDEELKNFSCDYQNKIKELHNIYPNAIFVAQKTFFDWDKYKEMEVLWNKMLSAEKGAKSLIYYTASSEYKNGAYNSEKTWYYATDKAIEYYMNPYNFLNEKNIFMFESLYNKNYHTKEGIEKILKGSFMEDKECPGSDGKKYSEVLKEAGEKNNVSPYMLASRLIQEQGTKGTSSLISGKYSGYEGYYNYFNISASGKTDEAVIKSGLEKAKAEKWESPYLAIVGGAKFVYKEYVGINDTYGVKGQMTLYLQKWDPYGPVYGGHQYMQNITAPVTESSTTYKSYSSTDGYKNFDYVFYIPIYSGAPNTSGGACNIEEKKEENKETPNNEIVIKSVNVDGNYINGINLNTSIDSIITKLKNDTAGNVVVTKNANNKSSSLATGDKITITKGNNTKTYEVIVYGDVNGDGAIKASDYVKIKNHIMDVSKLSGAYEKAADYNKDGSLKANDYVQIKNYIMAN